MTTNHPSHPLENKAVVILMAVAAALAWRARFSLDDAFIAYRHAENLAQGSPIESYPSFLWTVLLAAGARLGLSTESFAHFLTCLVLFPGSLLLSFLSLRLLTARWE